MDKLVSVHSKNATKRGITKKRPVKVVYISNPMKVKTSASEFRALVQELTGQDSDLPDPKKYPEEEIDGDGDSHVAEPDALEEVPKVDPGSREQSKPSDPFDDVFYPQMLENISGYFPSGLLFESAHVDVLRSLGAI